MNLVDVPEPDKPINRNEIWYMENKAVQLALWLNSIEPSFCAELSKASQMTTWKKDKRLYETLGPFACAIFLIFLDGEEHRQEKIPIQNRSLDHLWQYAFNTFTGSMMP